MLSPWQQALAGGFLCGIRTGAGLWLASRYRGARAEPGLLGSRSARAAATTVLAGELFVDKLPIPDRTRLPSLAARMAGGALVGGVTCEKHAAGFAALGSGGALLGAWAGNRFRRRFGRSRAAPVAGVLEDLALFGGMAALVQSRLPGRIPRVNRLTARGDR